MAGVSNNIPVPTPVIVKDDPSQTLENWNFFKAQWKNYTTAVELHKQTEEIQVATLLSIVGKDCFNIFQHLPSATEERQTVSKVLEAFSSYFEPKRNIIYERYIFNMAVQEINESIDQYTARLRKLANTCEFGMLYEELIRDRLVLGVKDGNIRRRLLRESDLTLDRALEICRTSEITDRQIRKLAEKTEQVNYTSKSKQYQKKTGKTQNDTPSKPMLRRCNFCGSAHRFGKQNCPAYGQTCKKCNQKNHFAKECRIEKTRPQKMKGRDKNNLNTLGEYDDSGEELLNFDNQQRNRKKMSVRMKLTIQTESQDLECQLDTGASCNVISFFDVCRILQDGAPLLETSSKELRGFGGNLIRPKGQVVITCTSRKKSVPCEFQVVDMRQPPLISAKTCQDLELLTVSEEVFTMLNTDLKPGKLTIEDITAEYEDVFTGLGCLPGLYKLETDPTVQPVQQMPRRVPVALRSELKEHLEKLEQMSVVKKVHEPTPWISNLVLVKKNQKLRVCIDPQDLNKALKRSHYQMPTIDEILPNLAKAKVFSVLDAKDGFWQIKLDEESSKLTTFCTPFGRYRWLRMPFGIKTAPEEYQRRQHEVLSGLKGVEVVADDIIVYGCGDTEDEALKDHDESLVKLLERAREVNLKLNKQKFRFKLKSVRYLGHLLTSEGLKADPAKIDSVLQAPRPENKQQLQSFLGFVVYLSKFLPHLSDISEPLRQLIKANVTWTWQTAQEQAFIQIKELVTRSPVLRFFDVHAPITIQCDSSSYGLGAVLLQEGQPVAFASRSLTATETHYAQIEKECLAILFACERFAQYILGKENVQVETDHKPLEIIFRKSLISAPKRLQRMLLRLQRYNINVTYKKGSEQYIADFLSRAPKSEDASREQNDRCEVYSLGEQLFKDIEQVNAAEYVNVSDVTLDKIKEETQSDTTMSELLDTIRTGWPETKDSLPENLKVFWNFRDELSTQNGVIYKSNKVVVPLSMHEEMIRKIHASHVGIEACIRKARDVLFWIGMATDIEMFVRNCPSCNKFAPAQQKEPLISYITPDLPWTQVGVELFYLGEERYLIVVDYFSDYWELVKLHNTSTTNVINHLKNFFSIHGIPKTVVSDNGPQFDSEEFREFAYSWNFKHVTSSPYHSQSNGKAESAVKIAKNILKKAKDSNEDIYISILEWRNTPTEGIGASPVQRLMSRRTRTLLPVADVLLKPKIMTDTFAKIEEKKKKQQWYYNRSARSLPKIEKGEKILIRFGNEWIPGICLDYVGPRSYQVAANGYIYRRNRKQLRKLSLSRLSHLR